MYDVSVMDVSESRQQFPHYLSDGVLREILDLFQLLCYGATLAVLSHEVIVFIVVNYLE